MVLVQRLVKFKPVEKLFHAADGRRFGICVLVLRQRWMVWVDRQRRGARGVVAAAQDRMCAAGVLQLQLLVLILKRHQLVEKCLRPLWLL